MDLNHRSVQFVPPRAATNHHAQTLKQSLDVRKCIWGYSGIKEQKLLHCFLKVKTKKILTFLLLGSLGQALPVCKKAPQQHLNRVFCNTFKLMLPICFKNWFACCSHFSASQADIRSLSVQRISPATPCIEFAASSKLWIHGRIKSTKVQGLFHFALACEIMINYEHAITYLTSQPHPNRKKGKTQSTHICRCQAARARTTALACARRSLQSLRSFLIFPISPSNCLSVIWS